MKTTNFIFAKYFARNLIDFLAYASLGYVVAELLIYVVTK